MAKKGFSQLREKQKFLLKGNRDVVLNFGKYKGSSFKDLSNEDPEYLEYLFNNWFSSMSIDTQNRIRYWRSRGNNFIL